MKTFEKEVVKIPEVMECYHMTGQYDFLLKVAIQDMKEYQDFMMNKLATIANIGTVQSFFVLTQSKQETAFALPLPARKKIK
ncbi:MAG: Lrp/AsnC ligand binding domain-containing protein [Puia sp.]